MLGHNQKWVNQTFGPDGKIVERDAFKCYHCQKIVIVKPGFRCESAANGDEIGRCLMCNKLICKRCLSKGCTPFERRLEMEERRSRLFQAMYG